MSFVHITFAVLATLRLTELFLLDKVTAGLRTKFPGYLWQCSRCLSVWCGAWVTIPLALSHFFWWSPYINWPFAFSWLLFAYNDWITGKRLASRGRQFVVTLRDGNASIERNEMQPGELTQVLHGVLQSQQQVNGKTVS